MYLNITEDDVEKISLKRVRQRSGMSLAEASSALNIPEERLLTYELNPSEMDIGTAVNIRSLYNTALHKLDFSN